jgi:hypothetical protein
VPDTEALPVPSERAVDTANASRPATIPTILKLTCDI